MISAGLLNEELVLETLTVTDDGMGGQTETWADAGTFRGRISSVPSIKQMELVSQGKETVFYTHKIFCNPMNVKHSDRVRWGSYYFEIVGVTNPSELYHHLEMKVREIVD